MDFSLSLDSEGAWIAAASDPLTQRNLVVEILTRFVGIGEAGVQERYPHIAPEDASLEKQIARLSAYGLDLTRRLINASRDTEDRALAATQDVLLRILKSRDSKLLTNICL
ncbi:MAG: uncharacterized protein KVP18_001122 [Porospora cf. gigantea A]|uniref:uncharacterized protein n=1 Tax=Porospora cf. gigantea A TaxID=2853593 RepID=UPI00355A09EA|nr:MAG: hypothetical protein KVP18_001122 [Porospora cf. gigantea A]